MHHVEIITNGHPADLVAIRLVLERIIPTARPAVFREGF
jgi:hypothetical protein